MRAIIAIHGIRSNKKDNWIYSFCDFAKADLRFQGDVVLPYYYGFLPAIDSVNGFDRLRFIRGFMKFLRGVKSDYPQADLNIVAHSYGTEISFQAIKRSGEDSVKKGPILVNKLILAGSIVSAHREIPYADTLRAGKIKEMHCYCSYEDEVCRYNPFGHSGCFGFLKHVHDPVCYPKPFDDLNIFNHQTNTLEHCDYFTKQYEQKWLDIIAK
ncbi:MAG: hypothetical protein WC578_01905 [Candidatus Omnitrophota bacterium]